MYGAFMDRARDDLHGIGMGPVAANGCNIGPAGQDIVCQANNLVG